MNTLPPRAATEPYSSCHKPTDLSELLSHMGCLCAICFEREVVPTL